LDVLPVAVVRLVGFCVAFFALIVPSRVGRSRVRRYCHVAPEVPSGAGPQTEAVGPGDSGVWLGEGSGRGAGVTR
jgi:hypothetical protein